MSRVLAIGLDGAEPTYVEALLDKGLLPNLQRLRSAGRWHRLRTEMPWRQGFTYNQLLAGRAPARRDPWDVCRFDPDHYRPYKPVAVSQLGGPPFYELVPGLRTIVFDLPWSSIGSSDDVVEVIAWGAHSPHYPRASRPPGLLRELDRRVGPHPLFMNAWTAQWHDASSIDALAEASIVGARRRAEAFGIIQAAFPDWELALVVMSETHDAGELLWHGVDSAHPLAPVAHLGRPSAAIEAIYGGVDAAVGSMVDRCPPDTAVVVFSLFGSCSGPGDVPSMLLLPELLARLSGADARLRSGDGVAWKEAGCPPVVPAGSQDWQEAVERAWIAPGRSQRSAPSGTADWPPPVPASARRPSDAERFGPAGIGAFGRPIPAEQGPPSAAEVEHGEDLGWQVAARYRDLWPEMRAFALPSFSEGMVRVNLRGREAAGVVTPDEYDAVCDDLEAVVLDAVNPRTGRRAVAEVLRLPLDEAMDSGRYADLVVIWDGPTDALEHPATGLIGPFPFRRVGAHTDHAFALVCRDAQAPSSVGQGAEADDRPAADGSILDLPPTFLSLLGRPIPGVIQGAPLA